MPGFKRRSIRHGRGLIALAAILAAGLAAATVLPGTAQARPRGFPGALFGVLMNPVGTILNNARRLGRPVPHRRPAIARTRPAAPPAAAVAAGAGAGVAAGAAAANAATRPGANPAEQPAQAAATGETTGSAPADPRSEAARAGVSQLGRVGPAIWPSAYEDALGSALWPAAYAARFRNHGVGDVLATAFGGTPATAAMVSRRANAPQANMPQANMPQANTCGPALATEADWPAVEIERGTVPNESQRAALERLRKASAEAIASIRATCRDADGLTPPERVEAMQATLWAVRDAVLSVRAPLSDFYATLSDEQKRAFAAPPQGDEAQASPERMSPERMARACGMNAGALRIDRLAGGKSEARASAAALETTATQMGQFLMASCMTPVAADPAQRLDAVADRLTAVLFAATNVGNAVGGFYASLDPAAKERLGGAP